MTDWRDNLVEDAAEIRRILKHAHRIAVLGIKPESRSHRAAHYVPEYLQDAGYEIVPVPVYYPAVERILGQPVYRTVADVPGRIDLVNVFRKPEDIPPHVPDLIESGAPAVWFQLGIRNDEAARELARAGIRVVQDRCTLAEHRRMS